MPATLRPRLRLITFATAVIVASVACGAPSSLIVPPGEDPVAVRQDDGSIWISWQAAPPGPVRVFVGDDPDSIPRDVPVLESIRLAGGAVVTMGLSSEQRPYFALVPDSRRGSTESVIVAERLIPLEGANNFRDLGGYPTADGRRVRWGLLYRSDQLGNLSDDDLDYLQGMGIRTVCDFRSAVEREISPNELGKSGTPRTVNPHISDDRFEVEELKDRILSGQLEDLDFAELLTEGNRAFARDYAAQFSEFLGLLDEPENLPLVFHCTAGKDRAGFGAFLVLTALGVPEKIAIDDYLLTQAYTQASQQRTLSLVRYASLFRTDPEHLRPLLEARRAYIRAAIDEAEAMHGSMDAYLENELGLTPEDRAELQELLLE